MLSRLEDRMNEFVASKASAGGVAIERARAQQQLICAELQRLRKTA